MKLLLFITITILELSSCGSSATIDDITAILDGTITNENTAVNTIDRIRKSINKEDLIHSTLNKYDNGVEFNYEIYSNDIMPLIIESEIYGGSYTINTTYYLYDSTPYYINGMMRDQYRQSGNFTHQEQVIYLNNKKVIRQLKRSESNKQDYLVDLSHYQFKDVTKTLIHPTLDAQENKNTVLEILSLSNE